MLNIIQDEYHGIIPNLFQLVYVHILLMSASISLYRQNLPYLNSCFSFNRQINCLSLSTGGNEAVQARASFSSSGKHPKSLKHHFHGCKYSYNFH